MKHLEEIRGGGGSPTDPNVLYDHLGKGTNVT